MTRTNAENHFATLQSDSVSKWYAESRQSHEFFAQPLPSLLGRTLSSRRSAAFMAGHCGQIRTRRARFSSLELKIPPLVLPCSINDENRGRTHIATSTRVLYRPKSPKHQALFVRPPTRVATTSAVPPSWVFCRRSLSRKSPNQPPKYTHPIANPAYNARTQLH